MQKDVKKVVSKQEYIAILASKKKPVVHVTNNNRKCGCGCLCLSFTKSVCGAGVPCYEKCYCNKGFQAMASCQACYLNNQNLYFKNPGLFFDQLSAQIKLNNLPYFRFFECGDLPNKLFLEKAVEMVKQYPHIKFYMPTKKYNIVNDYIAENGIESIPQNLCIRFSKWSKDWQVANPYNLPVSVVNFKDKSINLPIPKNGFVCRGGCDGVTCANCGACFNNKITTIVYNEH